MSDQHEISSDIGSDGKTPQQQQIVEVEGMDTMRVKVTNVLEGFFKFARSASNLSSSQQDNISESGKGGRTSSRRNSNSLTSSKQQQQQSSRSRSTSPAFGATPRTSNMRGMQRKPSSKKVQFKEGVEMTHSGFNASITKAMLDDSVRSRDENLDASASSQGSWNVNIAEGRNRPSPTLADAVRGSTRRKFDFDNQNSDDDDDSQTPSPPKWFEKYMPTWVIRIRWFCGKVVLDDRFQIIMVILICINALFMGLATFDFISEDPHLANVFETVDYGFLVVFTIELALQLGYWGYQLFFDGWLLFDFVIVVLSWLLDGVQVFRSFRIFRAFRLVVRIPILKSLVYAVIHVMPRISSIMGLFGLIIYIFAVMSTTLFKDYYERGITSQNYFGRLDYSLFTLFQFVTLEDWGSVVREVAAEDYYANFIFGLFLTISSFILYSLVVAVVCDSFLMVESQIRKEIKEQAKKAKLRRAAMKKRKGGRNVFDLPEEQDDTCTNDDEEPVPASANPFMRGPGSQSAMTTDHKLRPTSDSFRNPSSPSRSRSHSPARGSTLPSRSPPSSPKPSARLRHPGNDETKEEVDDELSLDATTDLATPASIARTKSLASGELERKRNKKRTRKPVQQRIERVQARLDKLASTQAEILATLDDMCRQLDEKNGNSG